MKTKDMIINRIFLPIIFGIMMITSCLTTVSAGSVYAGAEDTGYVEPSDSAYVGSAVSVYNNAETTKAVTVDGNTRYDYSNSTDYKKCVEKIRAGLKNHESSIVIEIIANTASTSGWSEIPLKLMADAMAHTGKGDEGDYIRYQMSGYSIRGTFYRDYYRYEFCNIGYYTTVKQEEAVTAECNRIIKSLNLNGLDTYDKILKIYQYLCNNVTYDWTEYYSNSSLLAHSAYAALIKKKAVCQGYSVALYRLLLQAGIDARLVTGYLMGEGHSWNIVKLGSKYYCLDATNDAGHSTYSHFLREDNYDKHVRKINTLEPDFNSKYPISTSKYVKPATHTHSYGTPTWKWTGTTKAVATFTCQYNGSHTKKVTAKITNKVTQKATINAAGKKTYTATVTYNGKTYKNTKTVKYYLFNTSKTGIQKYNGLLYYTKNGVRYTAFTGFAIYNGKWYYVAKGNVSTTKTGIIKGKVNGKSGSWYVKKGKVQLSYSGTVKIGGKSYKVKNGKVVS